MHRRWSNGLNPEVPLPWEASWWRHPSKFATDSNPLQTPAIRANPTHGNSPHQSLQSRKKEWVFSGQSDKTILCPFVLKLIRFQNQPISECGCSQNTTFSQNWPCAE
jgi:hypothetical protein